MSREKEEIINISFYQVEIKKEIKQIKKTNKKQKKIQNKSKYITYYISVDTHYMRYTNIETNLCFCTYSSKRICIVFLHSFYSLFYKQPTHDQMPVLL